MSHYYVNKMLQYRISFNSHLLPSKAYTFPDTIERAQSVSVSLNGK